MSAFPVHSVPLESKTPRRWLNLAVQRFDEVLLDHAHCEKKAAAHALSLLQSYPEIPGFPVQMARLAREESSHLASVLALVEERGLTLLPDKGDPYAQALLALVRHGRAERRLDRFLVAAIIEARSAERLQLLAEGLTQQRLRRFYGELSKSEQGHQQLFLRWATSLHGEEAAATRLGQLVREEAEILDAVGVRPAIH